MLISSNFASQTRWSIFALGPQMYQAALGWDLGTHMLYPTTFPVPNNVQRDEHRTKLVSFDRQKGSSTSLKNKK